MLWPRRTNAWIVVGAVLFLVAGLSSPAFAKGISGEAVLAGAGGPVAVDGDTLVSGTSVFTRTGTTWTKQATLPITNPPSEFFEVSEVAVDGDTIVMGVVSTFSFDSPQPGFALVFARSGGTWVEQARLTGTVPGAGDQFGGSVDLSGDTIAVSALDGTHVFTRTGTAWSRQDRLTPAGSVALDGDTLLTGVTGATGGSAVVFTRAAGTWTQQAVLAPTPAGTLFGSAVDLDGDTAVVADLRDSTVQPSAGAVFVFERSGTTWTQAAKLAASSPTADLRFGTAVSVDGDHLVATRSGGGGETEDEPGIAWVFENTAGGWMETSQLTSADPAAADNFGRSAALDAGTIAIPAAGTASVATYVFHLGMQRIGEGIGLVDPATGSWYLLDPDGLADPFFYGNPGDVPFMGDWDCDGIDTPGLYRRSDGFVYLRNANTQGIADVRFFLGNPGDLPLAGDFDGDGCDTVSLYRPSEGRVFVIDELGSEDRGLGAAASSYYFGNPGDKPFAGDFDGDGVDTVGLHRESTGLVYFRNSHTAGVADLAFIFGDPGDRIIAGDWTRDGTDTPALYRPADTTFYFRHSNSQGVADDRATWGRSGWLPVAGAFGLFTNAPAEPGRPSVQDASAFTQAFLDARIAGMGAEASLTPFAAAQYADPGGLALYAGYVTAGVVSVDQADPSSFEVAVQLFGSAGTVREDLAVGLGVDSGGVTRNLIVRSARLVP